MKQTRKEELSIYYWLTEIFPSFVTVQEEFPLDEELKLPTVAITNANINPTPYELGGTDLNNRVWRIDIFAKNSGQRADYSDLILENLEEPVTVYDFDDSADFPPASGNQIGSLIVDSRKYTPIPVYKDLVKKLYWRGAVEFETHFDGSSAT